MYTVSIVDAFHGDATAVVKHVVTYTISPLSKKRRVRPRLDGINVLM